MKISIVIPVFNSEDVVEKTVSKLIEVLEDNRLSAEIILINDGSSDNSWHIIKRLAEENSVVKSINLVKNYGQHNAVLCGFQYASGDYVITMDDDLQNPPSEILPLIGKITSGDYDLVFGKFRQKKHATHRKLGSKAVNYLNKKIFDKPQNLTLTNFRIIRRDVIDRVLDYRTSYPYIPGLLLMHASNISNVLVDHEKRIHGKSNYNLRRIISLMSRLLINYSSYPLRILSSIGLVISVLSFLMASVYLFKGLIFGTSVQGWTTLVVLTSFLGGFIIALLGMVGEYLSRILDQLSSQKSFHVKEVVD